KGRARRGAAPGGRWPKAALIGAAAGIAGVALMVLAGVLIKLSVKTPGGGAGLIVEVNQPKAGVSADGQEGNVARGAGGHKVEIKVKPGTHQVEVTKVGFTAAGETVTLSDGGRSILSASLSRLPPENPAEPVPKPTPDDAVPQTPDKPAPPEVGATAKK